MKSAALEFENVSKIHPFFQHAKLSTESSRQQQLDLKLAPKKEISVELDGKKISDARLDGYHQSVPGDFHHTGKSQTGTYYRL